MKSIWSLEDLRGNEVGLDIAYEADKFFTSLIEKYPNHNPREMVELCLGQFERLSNRKIIEWRIAEHSRKMQEDKKDI